jgi:NodT family efflux transporter outer membrane factor (OMF) lipoprotein
MQRHMMSFNTYRPKAAAAAVIAAGLLAVLSGCGIPQLRGPTPGQTMPSGFFLPENFEGPSGIENSATQPTMEFFNDPYLVGLVEQALVDNQELKILAEDIQIANNEYWRRRGAYLPFLSFGSGAKLEKLSGYTPLGAELNEVVTPKGGRFPNPLPNFLAAGDVSWQIDVWRQLRNARDAQQLRYLGTIDGRNYVVTRVVAEIAENYYKLQGLDNQLATLDKTIQLQEQSLEVTKARKQAARDTELPVQRFEAEVRKNQSQKLIIRQEIIETENRINFLAGRFPQPVERLSTNFIDLQLNPLLVGVPSQLLVNRPDIRQAERELQASGLDIRVARAEFFPKVFIRAGVGFEAFNAKYLFNSPESLIYNVAGDLVAPVVNRSAIRAEYRNANARQLQALYDYQRTILEAFTEVVNQVSKVQNYSDSIEIKKQQLASLESAVDVAGNLFQNARIEYMDVLFAQRDRNEARMVLIETKQEQLAAIVNAYQALGGGWRRPQVTAVRPVATPPAEVVPTPAGEPVPVPAAAAALNGAVDTYGNAPAPQVFGETTFAPPPVLTDESLTPAVLNADLFPTPPVVNADAVALPPVSNDIQPVPMRN